MYVSFDSGESWQSLQLNLPIVPIADLTIHKRDNNLVVATQGRAFWVLDDLAVLHQIKNDTAAADSHLFKPQDTYRMPGGGGFRVRADVGPNPPGGVVVDYYLKSKPAGEVSLEFFDADGKSVRKFVTRPAVAGQPEPMPHRPVSVAVARNLAFRRMRDSIALSGICVILTRPDFPE